MPAQYDPNDPEQVERRQETDELRRQQRDADWRWLIKDPRGQRLVADLIARSGFLAQSFAPGDPLQTAFSEGMRTIGQQIYNSVLLIEPEAWANIHRQIVETPAPR